jgi:hypothetical protein
MPNPKRPTAAERLITQEQVLQSRIAHGFEPSPRVKMALESFGDVAPTPEEIERVTNDLMMTSADDALEFQTYAREGSRAENTRRAAAQRQYDAGGAPLPAVQQALASFKAPPTPEQIKAVGDQLRAQHGSDVGQQFETYAANLLAERSGRQGQPLQSLNIGQAQNIHPTLPDQFDVVQVGQAEDIHPTPNPAPPAPAAPVAQAGQAEPELVKRAKDILQGTGHIVTLGAIPAPESIKSGNDRLRGMVGLEPLQKKPRQGKTEGAPEPPRDKNKERDLLMEAKKINAE